MAAQRVRSGGVEQRSGTRTASPRSEPRERDGWEQRENGRAQGERLSNVLGWFSIGLGLTEVLIPNRLARMIGIRDNARTRAALRAVGLREIVSGVGILTRSRPAGWLWSRVGGDVMDLTLLGRAFKSKRNERDRVAPAIAAVLGVTILDVYDSRQLSRSRDGAYDYRRNLFPATIGQIPQRRSRGFRVQKAITVNRPVEEVYQFWRNFQNLPRFMTHLESVEETGERRFHWKAKGPAGQTVEWDAEITDERPNELISWRSLEGADVDNTGTVRFKAAPGGRGTEIHVDLCYNPPAGRLGKVISMLFGEAPEQQIGDDLRRFKQVMETGEVVHSDASIHRRPHPARPPAEDERVRMVGR